MTTFTVPIPDGMIDQRDLGSYEPHERGKNWVAVVIPDRTKPWGLDRVWLERGRGSCYVATPIKVGDYLEVGADYVRFSGSRDRNRRYLRVVARTSTHLTLREEQMPRVSTDIQPVNTVEHVLALLDSALRVVHKASATS